MSCLLQDCQQDARMAMMNRDSNTVPLCVAPIAQKMLAFSKGAIAHLFQESFMIHVSRSKVQLVWFRKYIPVVHMNLQAHRIYVSLARNFDISNITSAPLLSPLTSQDRKITELYSPRNCMPLARLLSSMVLTRGLTTSPSNLIISLWQIESSSKIVANHSSAYFQR